MSACSSASTPTERSPRRICLAVAGATAAVISCIAYAHDLGNVGDVYPIDEPDFLVEVKAIVKHKVDDGSWADIERKLQKDTVHALEHPAATGNFTVATTAKVWYFDPTATLTQAQSRIHVKPVAVAGSYLALARKLEQPVYFDQGANFTRRLGIVAIPALVSQDGNRLKIEEMVPQ
jgi:conjugal transfer pilus assembly protein TraW